MKNFTFTVTLMEHSIKIELPSGATLCLLDQKHTRFDLEDNELFLLVKMGQIRVIAADLTLLPKLEFDRVVRWNTTAYDLPLAALTQHLVNLAEEAGLSLRAKPEPVKIPKNLVSSCNKATDELLEVLNTFGIKLEKKKISSSKAQHRWNKSLANIEFFVKRTDSQATVVWQKSNQLVIKAGAKLAPTGGLKADGTPGLAYRFTQTLREEQQASWDPNLFITTEDIILRSVNEVGHFLYFAGTNSWLELIDNKGRTLHEWAAV
jgi:hypothetical protein